MNFPARKVSKVGFTRLALGLATMVPGSLSLECARLPDVPPGLASTAAANCAPRPAELRFEMLAPDAEPSPPPAHGPQVCLAVYRMPPE